MTEVPDWAVNVPSAPVHDAQPDSQFVRAFTAQQLFEIGAELIEQFLKRVVLALVGAFVPGISSFEQLQDWAEDNVPFFGDLIEVFTGVEDGDLNDLGTWVNNLLNNFDGFQFGVPLLQQLGDLVVSIVNGFLSWVQSLFNPLGFGTTPVEFNAWLNNLPSIGEFVASITGIPFGDLDDLQAWFDQQVRNSREFWNKIVEAMDVDHDGDVDLNDAIAALQQIPGFNVQGAGGPATMNDTWQQWWDGFISALSGTPVAGRSPADATTAANQLATSVTNHEITLGLRGIQPTFHGYDPTTEVPFSIPQATVYAGVNSTTIPMTFIRTRADTVYGKISWLGYNMTGITSFFVQIYKVYEGPDVAGTAHGDIFFMDSSPNLTGDVSDALSWNTWDFEALQATAGDLWAIRLVILGGGTYQIAGFEATGQPINPLLTQQALGAFQAGSTITNTHLVAADTTWDTYAPWFGLASGDVDYHAEVLAEVPADGPYSIPEWANFIDYAMLPGAGGGRASDPFGGNGQGGGAGAWSVGTLGRGIDFHSTATTIAVAIGAGGAGGTFGPASNPGAPGTATTLSFTNPASGTTVLTAPPGVGGTLISPGVSITGASPGSVDWMGRTFYGGGEQTISSAAGIAPGGGGSGGRNAFGIQAGGNGAPGVVWFRARQV